MPSDNFTSLTRLRPALERTLVATRYFQAIAITIMALLLAMIPTYIFLLSGEQTSAVLTYVWNIWLSTPETPAGLISKFAAISPLFLPIFSVLAAGGLANFEKPASLIIAFGFAMVFLIGVGAIAQLAPTFGALPPAFFYIQYVAIPINITVQGVVVFATLGMWSLSSRQCDALRDGLGIQPLRTLFLRITGLPAYVLHLGSRRRWIIPLFLLSSALLALSLYPFFFSGAFANKLYHINRAECMLEGSDRLSCFQNQMLLDAVLFPVYVIAAFAILLSAHIAVRRLSRRSSITPMQALLESDERSPVVFLRPFNDDQVRFPKLRRWSIFRLFLLGEEPKFFEHQVLEEMSELGPVVAIGDPSKAHSPFGAARDYFSDEEWQARAIRLIENAKAIILVVSDTPGVWWEVETLLSKKCIDKTLIVFPLDHSTKAQRLWIRLNEALSKHGMPLPATATEQTVGGVPIGLYHVRGRWEIFTTEHAQSVDTLIILRLFGQTLVKERYSSHVSPRRYPFSLGLVALLLVVFFFDDVARLATNPEPVVAKAPSNWNIKTVVGAESDTSLGSRGFFEQAAPNPNTGGQVAILRRPDASPDLVWFNSSGALDRTMPVRVRALRSSGRWPLIIPIGLDWHAGPRLALSIVADKSVILDIRQYSKSGELLRRIVADEIPELSRAQDAIFTPTNGLFISGQVSLSTSGRGPFVGKLAPNGTWEWYYDDFGGVGWGNSLSQLESGPIALALEIVDRWAVVGLEPGSDKLFTALSPTDQPHGAAEVITIGAHGTWHVAGRTRSMDNPKSQHIPVVAALTKEGTYDWATELPTLSGYFVQSILYNAGRTYVLLRNSSIDHTRSAIAVLGDTGQIVEIVDLSTEGDRSAREATISKDGILWIYGTAKDAPRRAPPIENISVTSEPWVALLKELETD